MTLLKRALLLTLVLPCLVASPSFAQSPLLDELASMEVSLQRQELLQHRLEARVKELQKEYEKASMDLVAMENSRLGDLQFAGAEVRGKLIGRCLEELMITRLDSVTNRTVAESLQESIAKKPNADSTKVKLVDVEIKGIQRRFMELSKQMERIHSLAEQGVVSKAELADVELKLAHTTGELESAKIQREMVLEEPLAALADQLSELRIDIKRLDAREAALKRELKKLSETSSAAREIESFKQKRDSIQSQLKATSGRLNEVVIDIEVSRATIDILRKKVEKSLSDKLKSRKKVEK